MSIDAQCVFVYLITVLISITILGNVKFLIVANMSKVRKRVAIVHLERYCSVHAVLIPCISLVLIYKYPSNAKILIGTCQY